MKIYWHKKLVRNGLFMLFVTIAIGFVMPDEHYSFMSVFGFICCAFVTILLARVQWRYRHTENWEKTQKGLATVMVKFTDNTILFPNGYHFRHSSIYKERMVPAHRINEVMLNTYPQSIVIDDREVIFMDGERNDSLSNFAKRNKIPVSCRVDIWSYILEPFLDTELEADEQVRIIEVLAENGILSDEAEAIRSGCKLSMLLNTYFTMEWVYYGHYHYLKQTTISEKKYWESMEVALRNYKPKNT